MRPFTGVLATVVVTGLVNLASCASGGPAGTSPSVSRSANRDPGSTTSTTTRPTTSRSTAAQPTTTRPAPTTVPLAGFPTPRAAADHLVGAYLAHDRAAAAQGAEPTAVSAIFSLGDERLYAYECDTAEFDTSGCTYRSAHGTAQVNMAKRPQGWVVTGFVWGPS